MPDYNLNAADCPGIQVPSAFLTPGMEASIRAEQMVAGNVYVVAEKFGINASHLDNVGMAGGVWAHAVVYGFELSAGSGLTLNISAGGAGVGASPTQAAAQTEALTDNADNYVWALQDGTITTVLDDPAAPAEDAVYLGMVPVSGGVQGTPDYSGRVENRGGTLYRRTADVGAPTDTPPAGLLLVTETLGGLYLWAGTEYRSLSVSGGAGFAVDQVDAGTALVVPAHHQLRVFGGVLRVEGLLRVEGKVRVEA